MQRKTKRSRRGGVRRREAAEAEARFTKGAALREREREREHMGFLEGKAEAIGKRGGFTIKGGEVAEEGRGGREREEF